MGGRTKIVIPFPPSSTPPPSTPHPCTRPHRSLPAYRGVDGEGSRAGACGGWRRSPPPASSPTWTSSPWGSHGYWVSGGVREPPGLGVGRGGAGGGGGVTRLPRKPPGAGRGRLPQRSGRGSRGGPAGLGPGRGLPGRAGAGRARRWLPLGRPAADKR